MSRLASVRRVNWKGGVVGQRHSGDACSLFTLNAECPQQNLCVQVWHTRVTGLGGGNQHGLLTHPNDPIQARVHIANREITVCEGLADVATNKVCDGVIEQIIVVQQAHQGHGPMGVSLGTVDIESKPGGHAFRTRLCLGVERKNDVGKVAGQLNGDRIQQFLFGGEIVVNGAIGDFCTLGQTQERHFTGGEGTQDFYGRVQELLSGSGLLFMATGKAFGVTDRIFAHGTAQLEGLNLAYLEAHPKMKVLS